ncbi:N-acetylmuramoyl-L-alanine amidase [Nocardia nova]|nr:N-acetylmuramoyl-L-alanine amidase [Nocardia nova]
MSQLQADVTILSPNDSGQRNPAQCQLIVIHTNEGPATGSVSGLLNYLANPAVQASYTIIVGGNGQIGRSNDDNYIPWAAGSPANERGLHLCCLGYASDTRADWLARPAQLDAAARVIRDWSDRYGIPITKLSGAQMRAGQRGVGGHADTVDAWHATDHHDPGPGFPYDVVLGKAVALGGGTPAPIQEDDMPSAKEIVDAFLAARPTQPDGSTDATVGELLTWTDKHAADLVDQAAGPKSKDQRNGLAPTGWPQLGGRSLVDAVAVIGVKLGIPGFKDPSAK